jgi:CDP-diacylglycerol---serine O-phosphatidyltransferase
VQYSLFADAPARGFVLLEILYVIGVALLMASRIPHFSGKSIGRVPREYVAVVLIGLAAAILLLANFPLQTLVALTLAYLASVPVSVQRFNKLRRGEN